MVFAPLPVSVNVSARQLAQPEPPDVVRHVLAETALDAADLAIEVTETALIEDSNIPRDSLRELTSLGINVLLAAQGAAFAIVRAIAAMASALGLDVVAEGVESAEQPAYVQALGCGSAQGYHYARPAPAKSIEPLITFGLRNVTPGPQQAR